MGLGSNRAGEERDTYFVKSRDGSELRLKLAPKASVLALMQASLADIKHGSDVGVAAIPLAVMRGTGEGHRSWDLQASSTMANGNVEKASPSSDGRVLTLNCKG